MDMTEDDFHSSGRVVFKCPKGHSSDMRQSSFVNKQVKYRREEMKHFCAECDYFDKTYERVLKETGHKIIRLFKGNKCDFLCASCGSEASSFTGLLKNGHCMSCRRVGKKDITDVNARLRENSVLYEVVEYANNKNATARCFREGCLKLFKCSISDLMRGRGCPHCAQERRAMTNFWKNGSLCVFTAADFAEKSVETCNRLYGERHAMMNPEVSEKSKKASMELKEYRFPSGQVCLLMGYEHHCLDQLLLDGVLEQDLVVGKQVPTFDYFIDGVQHKYFPDIMIKAPSVYFIEVKSEWTYECDKEKNLAKWRAVRSAGFEIEIWIYKRDTRGKVSLAQKFRFADDL